MNSATSLKTAQLKDLNVAIPGQQLTITRHDDVVLRVDIGCQLATDVRPVFSEISDTHAYYNFRLATLRVTKRSTTRTQRNPLMDSSMDCYDVTWRPVTKDIVAKDAIHLDKGYWYGGAEMYEQHWPINKQHQRMMPYVTNDFFQGEGSCGDLLERFWFCSSGVGIYVPDDVPLHVSFNDGNDGMLVLKADYEKSEYKNVDGVLPELRYTICVADDVKTLWMGMYHEFFDNPSGVPDTRMFKSPIWSTWARYKVDITQDKVIEYAKEICKYGFSNSQLELDDMYTTKYGEFDFDPEKFPNPKKMIEELHSMGFRFTTWMHPFANYNSKAFAEGVKKGYWVTDGTGKTPALTTWWQGVGGILDTTNQDAYDWFVSRLRKYQENYGIDSFKFDAGETNWVPPGGVTAKVMVNPCEYTSKYVEMVSNFGSLIETRVGFKTQRFSIFVRMMDKNSYWGYDNGLKTMIPSALLMSMLGYQFILPDMIGGNGYPENMDAELFSHSTILPSKELFIRWTQVSAYLPSMQFSFVPWQYDEQTIEICRDAVKQHEEIVTPIVLQAATEAVTSGTPIIRPLWWLDATDDAALQCDSQFLVGDGLLVAPVLEDGARSRHVYLPRGRWRDNLRGDTVHGPRWLNDYSISLHEIATFNMVS